MCTYKKKQQFRPLYSYQKFLRSGKKIRERPQATERVLWEINYPKFWTGSLSEVDLGGYAHAFDEYLPQRNKPVYVKLHSRKHVLPKAENSQSFIKCYYHNHKLQTNPSHRKEEQHNNHKTPRRRTKPSNQLSLTHQDDYKTRTEIKLRTTKHRAITDSYNGSNNKQKSNNNQTTAL